MDVDSYLTICHTILPLNVFFPIKVSPPFLLFQSGKKLCKVLLECSGLCHINCLLLFVLHSFSLEDPHYGEYKYEIHTEAERTVAESYQCPLQQGRQNNQVMRTAIEHQIRMTPTFYEACGLESLYIF